MLYLQKCLMTTELWSLHHRNFL